jgi:hypothetical protein
MKRMALLAFLIVILEGFSQKSSAFLPAADRVVTMKPKLVLAIVVNRFGKMSTTRGSAFGYDTHVPVIFMGPGIKAGKYHSSIAVNDIAPTLAAILDVEIPSGSEGRILSEMFSDPFYYSDRLLEFRSRLG